MLDPKTFPTGYTIHQRLVAPTFARIGCFNPVYAKTRWTFTDTKPSGKTQELLYWDDGGYASVFDVSSYQTALARKKEEDANKEDVDAFLSSLDAEDASAKGTNAAEAVLAPPAISLNLTGTLYAGCCGYRDSIDAPMLCYV